MIRGVDATEIMPQHIRSRNFAKTSSCQSVLAASMPMTARARTGRAPTYRRNNGGSRHHAQSLMTMPPLRRSVRDVACITHRSVCDACVCRLVAADRE